MTTKAEMLSSIRASLGSPPPDSAQALQPPVHRAAAGALSQANLVSRFRSELERVGGCFALVHSDDDVCQYLRTLIPGNGALVAISDGAEESHSGLRQYIAGLGAKVIPSVREFLLTPEGEAAGQDCLEHYKRELFEADLGVTCADYAIADTGTLVISSKRRPSEQNPARCDAPMLRSAGEQHRLISLVPPVHVCLVEASAIVADLAGFFSLAHSELYSSGSPPLGMTFITGPSRTADIELSLTIGVHGPRQLHVLVRQPDQ